MAKKRPAKQGGSVSKRSRDSEDSPKVSRKVLRGGSAPYERKDGEGDVEDDKDRKSQGGKAKDVAAEGKAAEKPVSAAKAEDVSRAKTGTPEAAPKAAGKEASPEEASPKQAAPAAGAGKDEPKGAPRVDETAKAEVAKDAEAGPGAAPSGQGKSEPSAAGEQAPAPAPLASPAPAAETEVAELLPPHLIDESWDAEAPAPPPGKAPPGDSRSFRRHREGVEEFVLIYRNRSFLITRAGRVGCQGKWTVVEYPTLGSAAHAYAQECSELTAQGYRDLR